VEYQIDEPGAGTVQVRVTVTELATRAPVIAVEMGWVHVGRAQRVIWPRRATLKPGSYMVSLTAHDHDGNSLLRRAHGSGQVSLTIAAQAKTPPKRSSSRPLPSALALQAGVPTPAETAAAGAVFPLAGAHSFGGPGNRFGAPRSGYTHQGQDVLTAEGTAVVVPMAGTILTTGYQAGGAGYYAVERTDAGLDFMLAHCESQSLVVSAGEAVSAGQALCAAGQTGDATTAHLYFEVWVGGWQAEGAHTIDPLPYLQAWERRGAVG
jgi:murein DD-endopeptidase MepM/ murein hydrolase activator NlpD